ncbi:hypothetical protein M9H77_08103 [Catharanthus roseus]|uniref:Uncharacterized protein n=1 Tax=Catharanthus roseus TaxID=4058 RepID=A0ACC0BWU6_CATRO|nr:hypothetical protein M9H77_08103 [Catharanthus roseus]
MDSSKKKHKKSKKNEGSDTVVCEAEQGSNECQKRRYEKEDVTERKIGERRDKKEVKEKKKRLIAESNEGIVENNDSNVNGQVGEFPGAEDCNGNIKKNIQKVERKKKKKENDKTEGGSGHRLQENNAEDAESNVHATVNETCGNAIPYEKEDITKRKINEIKDKEKTQEKKKILREDSNEGNVENNKANVNGQVGEFSGAEDLDGNINKDIQKKEKKKKNKKKKKENDTTEGGSGHRLQDNDFEDAETSGNAITDEKEVETMELNWSRDLVAKVGKNKRKSEKNQVALDKGSSQQDNTQLTDSGKRDMKNQSREYFEKSDDGCGRKITEKAEKKKNKKRKREKGKEMDGPGAARAGILDKENNHGRADSTMNEQEDKNVNNGKTKGKTKKATSVGKGSQDSKPEKSPKKVRFSANVEVFPPSDVVGSGIGKTNDTLVLGKRFSKEEDEIVKQAVYNYIEANCLGDEGLNMVLNCRKHRKLKNCWKEIGAAIPYRPYAAVYSRAHILFQRSENRKWTEEEKEMVLEHYKKYGPKYKDIADEIGKHRWHVKDAVRRLKVANKKTGRWSQEEYQTLFELVNADLKMKFLEEKNTKHGMLRDNIPWSAISDKLTTRSDATCCLKWYGQLTSPMVSEGKWSDADDYRLINELYQLDASCIEDVDWDNLLDHRSGDVCRTRWNQMVLHIGNHRTKSFPEQVELLANRYCPDLLDAREAWDNKPVVS